MEDCNKTKEELISELNSLKKKVHNFEAAQAEYREREKKLREDEKLFRTILYNISDAVFLTDDDGDFTFVCYNANVIFGYSKEEIEDMKNIRRLLGENIYEREKLFLQGEIVNIERKILNRDGKERVLLVNVKKVDIQGGTVLYTCRDITGRKSAEEKLSRQLFLNESLAELSRKLISSSVTIEEITEALLEKAKIITKSKYGYVTLIDSITKENVVIAFDEMVRVPEGKKITFKPDVNGDYRALCGHSLNCLTPFYTNSPDRHIASTGLPPGHKPVKRFLSVPVILDEKPAGQINLANSLYDYDEEDLGAVARLAAFHALVIQRKRAEEALHYRLAIEKLAASISSRFINISYSQVDSEIEKALKSLVDFVDADQAFINLYSQDLKVIEKAYIYCKKSGSLEKEAIEGMSTEPFRWLMDKIKKFEIIHISSLDKVPSRAASEKELFRKAGIKSILEIPLMRGDFLMGLLGFSSIEKEKKWNEDDIRLLRMVGEVFVNLFERIRMEEALRKSEERFRDISYSIADWIWEVDKEGKYIYAAGNLEKILGYKPEEIEGKTSFDLMPLKEAERVRKIFEKIVVEKKPLIELENYVTAKDGRILCFLTSGVSIMDKDGELLGYRGVDKDITEKKKAEEELLKYRKTLEELVEKRTEDLLLLNKKLEQEIIVRKEKEAGARKSERLLNFALEQMPLPVIVANAPDVSFHTINSAAADLLVKETDDPKSITLNEQLEFWNIFYPDGRPYEVSDLPLTKATLCGEKTKDLEVLIRKADKDNIVSVSAAPLYDEEGNIIAGIVVFPDITEIKQAERKIKASLFEKEILLKEIHHRVKNNLQIISSLLNLQAGNLRDSEFYPLFKESQNRVRSMALVHEILYQSDDLAKIDFSDYVSKLSTYLFRSYGVNPGKIILNLNVKNIFLEVDRAIPCGLIINELLSNVLKYAFPDGKGKVSVDFQPGKEDDFLLEVRDDGIGLPEEVDFKEAETLGLNLVTNLVEQLDGEIKIARDGGTGFEIRF